MSRYSRRSGSSESLNSRVTMVGITLVVLSVAVVTQLKGAALRSNLRELESKKAVIQMQLDEEDVRARHLEEERVNVQMKEYIEKMAKEKLGMVNGDEIILKPSGRD